MLSRNKTNQPQSWGRYPKIESSEVKTIYWRNELPDLAEFHEPVLPYAYGAATAIAASMKAASLSMSATCSVLSLSTRTRACCAVKQGYRLRKSSMSWFHAAGFCPSHLAPSLSPSAGPLPTTFTAKTIIVPAPSAAMSHVLNYCAPTASALSVLQTKIVSFSRLPSAASASPASSYGPKFS